MENARHVCKIVAPMPGLYFEDDVMLDVVRVSKIRDETQRRMATDTRRLYRRKETTQCDKLN